MLTSKINSNWKTPRRRFRVVAKQINSVRYVPPSEQKEMVMEGKEVKTTYNS